MASSKLSQVDILSTSPPSTIAFSPSQRLDPRDIGGPSAARSHLGKPFELDGHDGCLVSHSPADSELTFDHAYLSGQAVARPSRPGNPLKYPNALASPMPIEHAIVASSPQVRQPELREGDLLQLFDETLGNCDQIRTIGESIQGRIEGTQPGPLKLMGSPVLDRRSMFKHASPDAMVVHSIATAKPQAVSFAPAVRFQPQAPGFWPRQPASAFSNMDTNEDQ